MARAAHNLTIFSPVTNPGPKTQLDNHNFGSIGFTSPYKKALLFWIENIDNDHASQAFIPSSHIFLSIMVIVFNRANIDRTSRCVCGVVGLIMVVKGKRNNFNNLFGALISEKRFVQIIIFPIIKDTVCIWEGDQQWICHFHFYDLWLLPEWIISKGWLFWEKFKNVK